MENTVNYNLKKPGQDDFYNVADFNSNADIIDGALKTHDTQLAQIVEDVAEIPTIIDESLGGAKIRDNNGVLETLVGEAWIPILKEGDVMPILPNVVQVYRAGGTPDETYTTIVDITGKSGLIKAIAGVGDSNMVKITIDGVLVSLRTNPTVPSEELAIGQMSRQIGTVQNGNTNSGTVLDMQFKNSCKIEHKNASATAGSALITIYTE